jgi:hypothetical protein
MNPYLSPYNRKWKKQGKMMHIVKHAKDPSKLITMSKLGTRYAMKTNKVISLGSEIKVSAYVANRVCASFGVVKEGKRVFEASNGG